MIGGAAFLLGLTLLGGVGANEFWKKSCATANYASYYRKIKSMNLNIPLQECFRKWIMIKGKDLDGHSIYSYKQLGGRWESMNVFDLERAVLCSMLERAGFEKHPDDLAIHGEEYKDLIPETKLLYKAIGAANNRFEDDYEWAKEQLKDSAYPITWPSVDERKRGIIEKDMDEQSLYSLRGCVKELKNPKTLSDPKKVRRIKDHAWLIKNEWGISMEDIERYDAGLLGTNAKMEIKAEETTEDQKNVGKDSGGPKIGARKKKKMRGQRVRLQKDIQEESTDLLADVSGIIEEQSNLIQAAQDAGWIIRNMNKNKRNPENLFEFRLETHLSSGEKIVINVHGNNIQEVIDKLVSYSSKFDQVIVSTGKNEAYLYLSKKARISESTAVRTVIKNWSELLEQLLDLSAALQATNLD